MRKSATTWTSHSMIIGKPNDLVRAGTGKPGSGTTPHQMHGRLLKIWGPPRLHKRYYSPARWPLHQVSSSATFRFWGDRLSCTPRCVLPQYHVFNSRGRSRPPRHIAISDLNASAQPGTMFPCVFYRIRRRITYAGSVITIVRTCSWW